MTFHEWCEISEKVIGEEGMLVANKFFKGEISFEECLKSMYEAMSPENMRMLEIFMDLANGKILVL